LRRSSERARTRCLVSFANATRAAVGLGPVLGALVERRVGALLL